MANTGWVTIIIDADAASKSEQDKLKSAYKLAVQSKGLRFRKDADHIKLEPVIEFNVARRHENRLILGAKINDTQFELIELETTLKSIYEQIIAELNAVADVPVVKIEIRKRIYGNGSLKIRECHIAQMWSRL